MTTLLPAQISPIDPGAYADAAARAPISDTGALIAFCALAAIAMFLAWSFVRAKDSASRTLQSVYQETRNELVKALGDRTAEEREQIKVIAQIGPALSDSTTKVSEVLTRELTAMRADNAAILTQLAELRAMVATQGGNRPARRDDAKG